MPILISIAVYIKASDIIENEMLAINAKTLFQTRQAIDKGLGDINKFIQYASFNRSFSQILFDRNINDFYSYDFIRTTGDLNYLNIVNGLVDDYYVYLKNVNKILTVTSIRDPQTFYGTKLQSKTNGYGNISYSDWYSLIKDVHTESCIVLSDKDDYSLDKKRTVLYLKSLPINMGEASQATMVLSLDQSLLESNMSEEGSLDKGWRLILDKTDKVIYSNIPSKEPLILKYGMFANDTGLLHYRMDDHEVVISYITSSVEDWKYVSIIPTTVFTEKIVYVKKLIIFSILLSILLGGFVAYLFSRRNYGPVNDLIRVIKEKIKITRGKGYNEYRFINDAINDTLNENEKINFRLKQQNTVLRSNFLMRLLKGRIEDNTIIVSSLEMYDLHFDTENFAVMLFYIEDFNELFQENDHYNPEEKLQLVQFIITNVIEEMTGVKTRGYMTEVDQMLACIINYKSQDMTEGMNDMISIAHEAGEFILENFRIHLMASISGIHKTFIGISEAYQEALEVMEYKRATDISDIICYDDIKSTAGNYNYPIETEHQLINCVKTGDFEAAVAILNEVFEKNFSKTSLSNDMLKCLMFDLVSTMLKTLPEVNASCGASFLNDLNIMKRLMGCSKVQDMKHQMTGILKEICTYIHSNRKCKKEHLIDNITEFVEHSYQDANLSVSSIADRFQLTPTYLTKLFKEQTGEGLFDHITRIRMEKAMKILKNQEYSIKDVAEMVGYYSSTAFIRTFKKYEGVTPGLYKEI